MQSGNKEDIEKYSKQTVQVRCCWVCLVSVEYDSILLHENICS